MTKAKTPAKRSGATKRVSVSKPGDRLIDEVGGTSDSNETTGFKPPEEQAPAAAGIDPPQVPPAAS